MRLWPRRTIRNRFTFRLGGLFFLGGLLLLTLTMSIVVWSVWTEYEANIDIGRAAGISEDQLKGDDPLGAVHEATKVNGVAYTDLLARVEIEDSRQGVGELIDFSLFSLAVLTVIATLFGFWTSGRMLRPVSAITAAARRISDSNLSERLEFSGPDDELKDLADTFDGMLDRLEGAFYAQKDFMSNASHELRTPLTIMKTELDVNLSDPSLSEVERQASIAALQDAVARSDLMIDRLLVLAGSEEILDREPVDIAAVAQEEAEHVSESAAKRGLRIELQLGAAEARGDGPLLGHMVGNLIQNAAIHNRADGWIHIETGSDDDIVWIEVRNSGDVISREEEQRLFDRFYRTQNARSAQRRGVGLGLPIIRSIARAHNGDAVATASREGGLEVRAWVAKYRVRLGRLGAASATSRH